MTLQKPAFAMLEFLAAEPRMRAASPEAVTLFLRALHLFGAFGQAHPQAKGEDYPANEILHRLCGMTRETFKRAKAELVALDVWAADRAGGIDLGPLPSSVWQP